MPAVSENPAYQLVTLVHKNREICINQSNDKLSSDYEDVEEVYFKQTTQDNTVDDSYEPVECPL